MHDNKRNKEIKENTNVKTVNQFYKISPILKTDISSLFKLMVKHPNLTQYTPTSSNLYSNLEQL
jgi:hypothetical protein